MGHHYPRDETIWVSCYDDDSSLAYIITAKPLRDYYYLYEAKDDGFVKWGRNPDPQVLEAKYRKERGFDGQ